MTAVIALSARPEALSAGSSGPINRHAIDVLNFSPDDPAARVLCIYPQQLTYRCHFEFSPDAAGGPRRRVVVAIPDLGVGNRVIVRLVNSRGSHDVPLDLVNGSQTVHEIEALALPEGGRVGTNSRGAAAPLTQLATQRATTVPAMAMPATPVSCDQILPFWVRASATDPVFTSRFGALNGSVLLSRPPTPGSPVRTDNLPEWLITYSLSATRVQFIAHYEVIYRVGICPERIERA